MFRKITPKKQNLKTGKYDLESILIPVQMDLQINICTLGPFYMETDISVRRITWLSDISAFSKFQMNITRLFVWETRYIG